MLDVIRPWFQLALGGLFLVPLVLRRENGWLGVPIGRAAHPVRFWIMLFIGTLLVASGLAAFFTD